MSEGHRSDLVARALLTVGTLAPYWPLLTFSVIHVPDDGFMSDLWNAELAGRVLAGAAMRAHGSVPAWTSLSCSGSPSISPEPLSLLSFSALAPAAALDLLLIVWILVAAHGAYGLARRLGASRPGAWLAGYGFALSGYVVTQLKHLGIVGTVVWLPLGLLLLDRALERGSSARRALCFSLFGLVVGEQALTGFPQSLYICGLAYAAFAMFRVLSAPAVAGEGFFGRVVAPLSWALLAVALGAAVGAALLWPLAELGSLSDRGGGNSYEWATQLAYWPRDALTFLFPYVNGDASDASYVGDGLFWEDYGYVGALTFLLAVYAAARGLRDGRVLFWLGLTVAAFALVLGPATPVFRLAFDHLPGFSLFRLPTRFLVVVELGLCVLAALGLTRLPQDLAPVAARLGVSRLSSLLPVLICAVVELDLIAHQVRQNPMVDGPMWLAPPVTVRALQAEPGTPRVFTPLHMAFHAAANRVARGWQDLRPYFALRDLVQPNSNLYWDLASVDCYSGIGARWFIDAWGDHSRRSLLVQRLMWPHLAEQRLETRPAFAAVMRAYGVTHVISPFAIPALEPSMAFAGADAAQARVYRVLGSARARVVEHAEVVDDTLEVVGRLSDRSFDPDALVVLSDAPASRAGRGPLAAPPTAASARIVRDVGDQVEVRVSAPRGGYLVLSDTYYPGWTATVDGRLAPIYRANLYVRAVPLAPGAQRVVFEYRPRSKTAAEAITLASAGLLGCVGFGAGLRLRRERRARRSEPARS